MTQTKSKIMSAYQWTRRQRAQTLAAALVFFSTMLSLNHPMQIDAQSQSTGNNLSTTSKLAQKVAGRSTMLHNLHSRGGSSISSSTPSKAMTNFLQRGGAKKVVAPKSEVDIVTEATTKTFKDALIGLKDFMQGPKSDTLILLLATSLITPLCKMGGLSPIIGFLAAGMALGPNALGLISGIHTTETLAELGIVFFLFEMGIELSVERLISMKKDVFGLGLSQFVTTACAIAALGSFLKIPANALVVLGGGLALSSSAFVLQLLKDKNQLASRFGKASFGILLFQDLAVVPLLVVTPILAGGGQGLASALGSALVKAVMALSSITFVGRVLLNPMFKLVAQANSQEAFLGVVLLTVLSMSFLTEGLGLSNTLGAFLAGILLSETKYRYQIEADIAPFRGILLGLFFVTVGFEIDLGLIARNLPLIGSLVTLILLIKTAVITVLCKMFGLSSATSLQTGLILSQGGEFAFVAFGLARNLGILDPYMTKVMLTSVALTMALTPLLSQLGEKVAKKLEEESKPPHYLGQDSDANEIRESNDFVVVVGYGMVGKLVCDLLDKKLYKYVGLEVNPNKAIEARNKGLPVFYGDIGRPEVADAFGVEKAKAIIVTISDKNEANRAVIALRRKYPEKKIFARAVNADHAERLQRTLDVIAMVPIVPEDNVILSLPFGGAVLRSLGAAPEEVTAILESKRKEVLGGRKMAAEESLLELAQLGIFPSSKEKDSKVSDAKKATDGETVEDKKSPNVVEKKSPMVAEMIESISSISGGGEEESDIDDQSTTSKIENEDDGS